MAVYVDPLMDCVPNKNWKWDRACHLFADDIRELHAFAKSIGLRREWFQYQPGRLPHYDLNVRRRAAAIKAGAIHDAGHHILGRHIKLWKPFKSGLRLDGWPLCPWCECDELVSISKGIVPKLEEKIETVAGPLHPVIYFLEHGLRCLYCGWASEPIQNKGDFMARPKAAANGAAGQVATAAAVVDPGVAVADPAAPAKRRNRTAGGSIVSDMELVAMSEILKELQPFSPAAQTRVMRYVQTRLEENKDAAMEEPQPTPPEMVLDAQPGLFPETESVVG